MSSSPPLLTILTNLHHYILLNYEHLFGSLILLTILTNILFFQSNSNAGNVKWGNYLRRLNLMNGIALILFIISVIKILDDVNGPSFVITRTGILPLFGLLISLTYLFGFFGVTYAASSIDFEPNTPRKPTDGQNVPNDSTDRIIVIGGGVAGCTVALALANKGHAVTLIERDLSEQDRIVGELLQPGGLRTLERLGLSDCAKDDIDSINVHGYVIFDPTVLDNNGKPTKQVLTYPSSDPSNSFEYFGFIKSNGVTNEKSPAGRSFHHGRFIQKLRQKAIEHPSINVIEGTVTKLLEEKGNVIVGVEYKVVEKEKCVVDEGAVQQVGSKSSKNAVIHKLYSKLTLVADGIWSSQRKHLSPATVHSTDSWVGIIVKHDPMGSPIPHPYHGHVILTQPAPCLIYQISSTETRVLINLFPDETGSIPSISDGSMEKYLREEIAPQLPESFRAAFITAITPGHPLSSEYKSMPSKFFNATHSLKKGAFLIGDALNMRNPLTGGGMTVCIRDGELLAKYLADINLGDYNSNKQSSMDNLYSLLSQRYDLFLSNRIEYAGTINVLACALHGVFSTPNGDKTRYLLRQACFDYLALGGVYSAGPIGLLSGLTPKPLVLTTHFFLVALYGAKNILQQDISIASFQRIHMILRVACTIIMPLLKAEKTTILSNSVIQSIAKILFPPIHEMLLEK